MNVTFDPEKMTAKRWRLLADYSEAHGRLLAELCADLEGDARSAVDDEAVRFLSAAADYRAAEKAYRETVAAK